MPSLHHPAFSYNTHHFHGFGILHFWFEVNGIACQCFTFLGAFLLAAYSHFLSEVVGGSGTCADFIPGVLIVMYLDVCS